MYRYLIGRPREEIWVALLLVKALQTCNQVTQARIVLIVQVQAAIAAPCTCLLSKIKLIIKQQIYRRSRERPVWGQWGCLCLSQPTVSTSTWSLTPHPRSRLKQGRQMMKWTGVGEKMPLSWADFRQNNKICKINAVGLNRCNSSLNARNIDNNGDKHDTISFFYVSSNTREQYLWSYLGGVNLWVMFSKINIFC